MVQDLMAAFKNGDTAAAIGLSKAQGTCVVERIRAEVVLKRLLAGLSQLNEERVGNPVVFRNDSVEGEE